tara:strand:+ start:4789 stop:5349 length:561 start_codon:yes stop_codon:yes gene_type:complete
MSEEIKGLTESGQTPKSAGDSAGQTAKGSTDNSSDSGNLIYENKKIRSRAQRAEEERDVLKAQLDKQKEQQLADQENYKQLANDRGDKIKALEETVGKESEVIGQVMDDLRSQLSEEDRELVEGFDYKKLKSFVTRYGKNNQKTVGTDDSKPGSMVKFEKDIWDMPENERKANWNTYLQSLVNRKH